MPFLRVLVRVVLGKSLHLGVIVSEFERALEHLIQNDRIVNHLVGRRRHSLVQQIAPAKLVGSHANCFGHHIHVALQGKQALRCAEATESAVWRGVGGIGF